MEFFAQKKREDKRTHRLFLCGFDSIFLFWILLYRYFDFGLYREPGNDGYSIRDASMQKYLKACVNTQTGEPEECRLQVGDNYIQCVDRNDTNATGTSSSSTCPVLQPCPTQPLCNSTTSGSNDTGSTCEIIWCRQYTIQTVSIDNVVNTTNNSTNLGYIPATQYCHTSKGKFSQDLGVIESPDGTSTKLGNCYFGDGITLVQRNLSGLYAYCDGRVGNTTYEGGYESFYYDPRFRPWYTSTKENQMPMWSAPYAFAVLGIGVTYSRPIYETLEDGKQVFAGVLGVDYRRKCTLLTILLLG